jgi:hypothetical protein
VRGYRGGGDPLGRRGLPVCDARLLVNLVAPAGPGLLLDPFAGVGGVALAARAAGWATVTGDLDPALRHGLGRLGGGAHLVADARRPPLRAGCADAVATEPPYDRGVGPLAEQALAGAHRLLRPGGATAWLCAAWQAPGLRAAAGRLGLRPVLDCPVDRKGLEVVALAWRRRCRARPGCCRGRAGRPAGRSGGRGRARTGPGGAAPGRRRPAAPAGRCPAPGRWPAAAGRPGRRPRPRTRPG